MLQQRLNALIKARVPTTIWFLSLMSPLRKSTKIRKKVASLIPMIPTKWYGNHMVCSTDRRIWKCPCKLFSFFNFFWLPTWPWREPFLQSKETGGIHTGNGIQMTKLLQRNNPFFREKRNKTKQNTTPPPLPVRSAFEEVN